MIHCEICNKAFKNKLALAGHKRMHGPSNGKIIQSNHTREKTNSKKIQRRAEYLLDPKTCNSCNAIIPYHRQSYASFCSSSCAASHNNIKRGPRNDETKTKIATGVINFYKNKPRKEPKKPKEPKSCRRNTDKSVTKSRKKKTVKIMTDSIIGQYSKIYYVTCAHCGIKYINRSSVKYCKDHKELYKGSSANRFAFSFNVYHFPHLFDIDYLTEFGWYDPVNNKNGLTRDHKISKNEAIRNDYDAYYIKHPVNCELMPFLDNVRKHTKSSISYDELVEMVDQYDLMHGKQRK